MFVLSRFGLVWLLVGRKKGGKVVAGQLKKKKKDDGLVCVDFVRYLMNRLPCFISTCVIKNKIGGKRKRNAATDECNHTGGQRRSHL